MNCAENFQTTHKSQDHVIYNLKKVHNTFININTDTDWLKQRLGNNENQDQKLLFVDFESSFKRPVFLCILLTLSYLFLA